MNDDSADYQTKVNRYLEDMAARDEAQSLYATAKRAKATTRSRQHDGDEMFIDLPDTPPALWGKDSQILWADGEPLMIAGDDGTGKTTIVHQLMAARLGLFDALFGLPVLPTEGRILYLAMDRPQQARRAGHRVFQHLDRDVLQKRLVAWQGPIPVDILKSPSALADWIAEEFGPDITEVYADGLKDMAAKISDDGVGAGLNSAIQEVIARGINWVGLHHPKKAQADNKTPNTLADMYGSRWLTAGHGSVLFIERPKDAGDNDVILVRQLKEPMDKLTPLLAKHDRPTGRTTVVGTLGTIAQQAQNEMEQRITNYVLMAAEDGQNQNNICAFIGGNKPKVLAVIKTMHNNDDLRFKKVGREHVYYHPLHAPADAN